MKKTPKKNARQEVREWFATRLVSGMELPALVKRAVTHFSKDHNFLKRFAQDFLYRAFYDLAIDELSQTRGPYNIQQAPMRLRAVKPSIWDRWEGHLEHAGNQYVSLPELTPTLWLLARGERVQRREAEERAISFGDRLVARCGPRQKVKHCWKPGEVDALWETLHPKEDVA